MRSRPVYREESMDALMIALELVPGGGVITVRAQLGEPRSVPLPRAVVGPNGEEYTTVDVMVVRAPHSSPADRAPGG